MILPIDFLKAPFKEKYLDEAPGLEPWHIFGEGIKGVDIANSYQGDIFINLPRERALEILKARENLHRVLYSIFSNFGDSNAQS